MRISTKRIDNRVQRQRMTRETVKIRVRVSTSTVEVEVIEIKNDEGIEYEMDGTVEIKVRVIISAIWNPIQYALVLEG